jgi:hypothetical protein
MKNERIPYPYDCRINLGNLWCLNWSVFKRTQGLPILQTWEFSYKIARVTRVMVDLQAPLIHRHRQQLSAPFALANREQDYKLAWTFFEARNG